MKHKKTYFYIFFILIVFISGLFLGKFQNNTYYKIKKQNNIEKKKYNDILKHEKKIMVIKYLTEKIENNEFIEIDVMNYLFEKLYKDANETEKINIYTLYFENVNNYITKYSDILNQQDYNKYLRTKINEYDYNSIKDINKIKNESLRTILLEMKINNLIIKDNNPYLIVNFNYEMFLNNFSNILDKEYLDFINLEKEASNIIINPNYLNINMEGLSWYLINFENFIKNHKNESLRYAAQHVYLQNLGIYFGVSNVGLFYDGEKDGNYKISKKFINEYNNFLKKYPNSSTTELINQIFKIINKSDGTYSISDEISETIYNYLENCDWIPVKPSEDNTLQIDDFSENSDKDN